jgi:predicted ATPase
LIVPVIADAIGFAFQSASRAEPKTQLFSYLRDKQALLLMDNLEHLLAEPGIELLVELLANAPGVKLLVTSRESLELQGEWVYDVQGLPVPESGNGLESLQNNSVELFLQRARRANVGFHATPQDYPTMVRICQLVEGNPLGIELAAAWVRTLSCAEIAQEIEGGLDFLSVSTRDIPARHRSLQAVFDHSWKLLSAEEQGVLIRLSVFQGGFRREAAEAVAGAKLPVLSSLVTKSILRRISEGRYDLHELIRQFTAERFALCPEEPAETQARHTSYYLIYFSQADGRLRSSAQRETLAELTAEMDNFRAAWEWAVANGEFGLIEQTLRAFTMLYDTRGWLQEGQDTLERALKALEKAHVQSPPDRIDQVALGHILASRSVLASRMGQYEQAQTMLERSLEILRPLNEPRVLVEAITFLGTVMELTGNYSKAFDLYTEGQKIAAAIGDQWFSALCLFCLIGLAGVTQKIVEPETTYEQLQFAVAVWRDIGDPRFTAVVLNNLGWNALELGRYDEALAALEESVALSSSVGDRWGLGFAYRGLGIIAQTQSEHLQALDLFRKSLDTLSELGARQDVARVLVEMSRSLFALVNEAEAGRVWREALRIAIETKGTFIALEAVEGLASLQAQRGEVKQALEMLMVVLNHPACTQETKNRASQLRAELVVHLTPQEIEAVERRAGAKSFTSIAEDLLRQE